MKKGYLFKKKIRDRRVILIFEKKIRRTRIKEKKRIGLIRSLENANRYQAKRRSKHYPKSIFGKSKKPSFSNTIQYFLKKKNAFSEKSLNFSHNILIPETFSLIDNYGETSDFLKNFLNVLYKANFKELTIDYKNCIQIDVGASICMDIILTEFIEYFKKCWKNRYKIKVEKITPINFENHDIKKILFSIGAFANIRKFKIEYDDIIPFPMIIGDNRNKNIDSEREISITKTVDYIIKCLSRMNRNLTSTAETNFYKVIGEVIQNSDEHSDTNKRYSIGYFEDIEDANNHYGVFNLSILNFGNTIYETFKNPDCNNKEVVQQMQDLSEKYTKGGLFSRAVFEEETLWTLYALQDGITRKKDWKRGNGSIRFIESFFKLKGVDINDDITKMVITSGNTRIVFNGAYKIAEKVRGKEGKVYKMMTFNESGNIEEKPNSEFVKFEKNYFPGTIISVKIRIDYENTEET